MTFRKFIFLVKVKVNHFDHTYNDRFKFLNGGELDFKSAESLTAPPPHAPPSTADKVDTGELGTAQGTRWCGRCRKRSNDQRVVPRSMNTTVVSNNDRNSDDVGIEFGSCSKSNPSCIPLGVMMMHHGSLSTPPLFYFTKCPETHRLHHQTYARVKLVNHGKKRAAGNGCVVQCCTSSSSSSSVSPALASVDLPGKAEEDNNGRWEDKDLEQQPLYLASENGWKAEVLAGLMYKLRNSPPGSKYACLVAESPSDAKLVGVVDVTALQDDDVLRHLHGAEEYLYVSGLAVSKHFRRRKIGSCLLKACEMLLILWDFKYLVLRAYEDDSSDCTLYVNVGYRVVSGDPPLGEGVVFL
ncbi:Acyl-CoA N-acyltransferases superfamily protein, putative isoform 2 [Hibiscus syriacus]|uniref:Acyl-CoA N-acyltransferases superfamily protein, putative isoform 2 n=1 Tax=Hibiscus syriacus TaxID=106335 RepID=A0A6A3AHQ8_HIBSY|nr:Acyl-CoA N-acyltransferases superfamily protein, putative isoform 2 [Hibiscus syriacus]